MNTVLQIALILLTLAGPLLTEGRYRGEESVSTKHRHRHHRQEQPPHHPLKMQKHLTPDDDNDDTFQPYEEIQKNRQSPTKPLPEDDDDDDEDDEDEDVDDNDRPDHHHHRNHRLNTGWGHRTRPDVRYSDYPSRTHVSPDTKDEDHEYVRAPARGHHRHHHHPHHEHHYSRSNEVHPRWRNSWGDDTRELETPKRWSRRKSRYKDYDDDDGGDGYVRWRGLERKWRSNDLRESIKPDDDEDIWKELGDYDDADVEDDESEGINDDYFEDISDDVEKPPYRTYEEIIKRLTQGEDHSDNGISVKRDYRNTGEGIEKFLMKDAYGNLKFNGSDRPDEVLKERKEKEGQEGKEGKEGKERKEGKEKSLGSMRNSGGTRINLVKSLNADYVDDYGEARRDVEEEEAGGEPRRNTVTQVEYPSTRTEPEHETAASTTSTPKPPVKITSRPIITITTQKTYERRNNTTILQQHSTNGLPSMRSGQKHQTKEFTGHPRPTKEKAGMREAIQHAMKVTQEGNCQWPRARVIPVRNVYPNPSTTYIPHCAILHRCSDDTGCCGSDALTCVPKQSHRVELYFYATRVGAGSVVEKLLFYNHTECECRGKGEYGGNSEEQPRQEHQILPPQNIRVPPQKKPCRCPSEFTPRIAPDGECQCKCFESDEQCIFARRGKVYFSTRDRICIQRKECAMPTCEFGEYIMRQGKCPRKKDKIDSIANYPSNNYHYRQRS